jgi:Fic/DOC family
MPPPYICIDGDSFRLRLIAFQSDMSPGKGLQPDGRKTQGGVSNATTQFGQSCDSAFADIDQGTTVLDLVDRSVRICRRIVEPHVFQDGNGRTSMYAIYLFLACWGYQLKLPPTALHAYLFGESQRDSLPGDMAERIAAFTVTLVTEAKCWSLVLRMERKLKALETTRRKAYGRYNQRYANPNQPITDADGARKFLILGKSAIHSVNDVQGFADVRTKARKDAKRRIDERNLQIQEIINIYCNKHSNPFAKKQAGKLIGELAKNLKREPTLDEIKKYLDDPDHGV